MRSCSTLVDTVLGEENGCGANEKERHLIDLQFHISLNVDAFCGFVCHCLQGVFESSE